MKVNDLFHPDEPTKELMRKIIESATDFRRVPDDAEPEAPSTEYEFDVELDDDILELQRRVIASGEFSWELNDESGPNPSSAITGPMLDRLDELAESAGASRSQLIRQLRFEDFVMNICPGKPPSVLR